MDQLKSIFGKRWNCDLTEIEAPTKSLHGLLIRANNTDAVDFDGTISSLSLKFNGRWGNYVLQLINMFYIAERLGCFRLYIHSSDIFPIITPRLIQGLLIDSIRNPDHGDGYELESVFFDMRAFQGLMDDLTPKRRRELALKYVKPLLASNLIPKTDLVDKGDLVIHIRSGDIFQGVEGQGGSEIGGALYIQPPLSFYTMIARSTLNRGSGHAWIISENSLNPTILPLVEALQKVGYAISLRLQHDLVSDLSYLLAARHAVFANGTIGIAIALLSEVVTDGYFFRKDGTGTTFDVDYFLGDIIKKHYILDDDGAFIRKGEWRNNAEQRDLMVSLPEERLSWEKTPHLINIALNRPARQSSISSFSQPDESRRAVDGTLDRDFSFHTEREHFPWWEVDLGDLQIIEQIVVYNRDNVPERAYTMQIYILDHANQWVLIHNQGGRAFGGRSGKPLKVVLNSEKAKAVRIQLPAYQYLHLRSIEVYSLA